LTQRNTTLLLTQDHACFDATPVFAVTQQKRVTLVCCFDALAVVGMTLVTLQSHQAQESHQTHQSQESHCQLRAARAHSPYPHFTCPTHTVDGGRAARAQSITFALRISHSVTFALGISHMHMCMFVCVYKYICIHLYIYIHIYGHAKPQTLETCRDTLRHLPHFATRATHWPTSTE